VRNAFAAAITELAARDSRVVLLSGDIGNRLFDKYKEKFPDRFYNCGVSEANMTGMAAGMALSGLRPFTYTITPFATTRALEQIRVDVCYHNVPVTIVGTGSGLSYASLGPTHHSLEDVAMLRCLPNMKVICPADSAEVRGVLPAVLRQDNPAYIRLGKKGEPAVHTSDPAFQIGRGIVISDGADICFLGMGNAVIIAVEAAAKLRERGFSSRVVSFHTVKPLDDAMLDDALRRFKAVVVVEEHSVIGGLGSAVAEWIAARRLSAARLLTFGTPDRFLSEAGDQQYARRQFGLTPEAIAGRVLELVTQPSP
jgi:transketolase